MVVYVDDMYKYPMGQYRRMKMSHMIADTDDELHDMASKIGVARRWYQGDHYDICMSMRSKAILNGAVPITLKDLSRMVKHKRRVRPTLKAAADKKALRERMARIFAVLAVIQPWREKNRGKAAADVIECPICGNDLHLSIAKNGHVWGKCETKGCVTWME